MLYQLQTFVKYVARFLYFWLSQAIRAYAYVQTHLLNITLRKDVYSKDKERNKPWMLKFQNEVYLCSGKKKSNNMIMKKKPLRVSFWYLTTRNPKQTKFFPPE